MGSRKNDKEKKDVALCSVVMMSILNVSEDMKKVSSERSSCEHLRGSLDETFFFLHHKMLQFM